MNRRKSVLYPSPLGEAGRSAGPSGVGLETPSIARFLRTACAARRRPLGPSRSRVLQRVGELQTGMQEISSGYLDEYALLGSRRGDRFLGSVANNFPEIRLEGRGSRPAGFGIQVAHPGVSKFVRVANGRGFYLPRAWRPPTRRARLASVAWERRKAGSKAVDTLFRARGARARWGRRPPPRSNAAPWGRSSNRCGYGRRIPGLCRRHESRFARRRGQAIRVPSGSTTSTTLTDKKVLSAAVTGAGSLACAARAPALATSFRLHSPRDRNRSPTCGAAWGPPSLDPARLCSPTSRARSSSITSTTEREGKRLDRRGSSTGSSVDVLRSDRR
jgi:hypothetical protein